MTTRFSEAYVRLVARDAYFWARALVSMPSRRLTERPRSARAEFAARTAEIPATSSTQVWCGRRTHRHITPVSRGGGDTLANCVTARLAGNGHKGKRLTEEARMSLMYPPHMPTLQEDMVLRVRRILVDQIDLPLASVPRSSRPHGEPWRLQTVTERQP